MSTELHQRLAALADDAPAPGVRGGGDLWAAGKRRQRRRTAAGVCALAACLLVVGSAVGVLRPATHTALPADTPDARGALPAQLHIPSRWTQSNDDDPVGPMAAVVSTRRGWSGDTSYAGVSAVTGEYRFLDLPRAYADHMTEHEPVLSPSGRFVAYWLGGSPSGAPSVIEGGAEAIVGVGVYDTVTGMSARSTVPTAHGLAPNQLLWVDRERLYFQAGELDAGSSPGTYTARSLGQGWAARFGDGIETSGRDVEEEQVRVPAVPDGATAMLSDHQGGLLFESWSEGPGDDAEPADPLLVDFRSGSSRPVPVAEGVEIGYSGALGPDGAVAGLLDDDGDHSVPAPVVVSRGGVRTDIPEVEAYRVEGWANRRVVVHRVIEDLERKGGGVTSLTSVNPVTGDTTVVTRMPPAMDGYLNIHGFASDLLAVPAVHRRAPDEPTDPRVIIAGGVGTALVGALVGLVVWRRRGRR